MYVPCRCRVYRRFWRAWDKTIGRDYRNVKLKEIERFSRQLPPLRAVRSAWPPHRNGASVPQQRLPSRRSPRSGQVDTHGSALSRSLAELGCANLRYRQPEACRFFRQRDDSRCRVPHMGDAGRSKRTRMVRRPPIPRSWRATSWRRKRAGYTPRIFIEEIDKFKLDSEFQARCFSRIIDAVHQAGGQIVATSNLDEKDLRERMGDQYGGGIIRRIIGPRGNQGVDPGCTPDGSKGGFYVNFWNSTIEQNVHPDAVMIDGDDDDEDDEDLRDLVPVAWEFASPRGDHARALSVA